MDSLHYTPRLGFWIATTFMIIITVLPVTFIGASHGEADESAAALLRTVGVALIPGICIGLIQASILAYPSRLMRPPWLAVTIAAIAIGWWTVFTVGSLFTQLGPSSISNQLGLATVEGFLTGALRGAIVGLLTGIAQGWVQRLSMRQWIIGNLISWSVGVGVPYAVIFVLVT